MTVAKQTGSGTKPPGARTEAEASRWVQSMFGRVAQRYDLLNHLLSFNLDRYWRRRTVRSVRETDPDKADMRTLVIIGSSTTRRVGRWVYTPRRTP